MPALALILASSAAVLPYKAVGTEPFWSVPDRDRTAALTIDVTRVPCSDGMSDRRYPDTVRVRIGQQVLNGCGGSAREAITLEGGAWRIALVNGRTPRLASPATLSFDQGALEGRVCNRLSGRYTLASGALTVGPIATTRMMCPPATMAAEAAVIGALTQTLYVHRGTDGLVLSNGVTSVTLKR